jgi:hypothetical protein
MIQLPDSLPNYRVQRQITITHTATGNWYGPKKYELRDIMLKYTTRHHDESKLIERFDTEPE